MPVIQFFRNLYCKHHKEESISSEQHTAFLTSLVELHVFNLLKEPELLHTDTDSQQPANAPSSFLTNIKEIFSETPFIRYTLASILFYFAWQIPWPLFSWYRVKILGANNVWISIFSLMSTAGSLIGFRFWVNFIEKHGNIKTLFFSTINIFIVPAVHAFFGNLYAIAAVELLAGTMFAGVNLALFNTLLEVIPNKSKTSYIAYYNSAITCATIISPLAGVSLLKIMNFKWAFITCALLRLLGSFGFLALSLLEEKEGKSYH